MSKWECHWQYREQEGVEVVEASTQAEARMTLPYQISKKLRGTTAIAGRIKVVKVDPGNENT